MSQKEGKVSESDSHSPAESPRSTANHSSAPSTLLNDREVEDIIRFINGVDSSVSSSPPAVSGGSSATAKQKTKQKCRKVATTI